MFASRLAKELKMLELDPPYGIAAWPVNDSTNQLRAQIRGPQDSPYERGVFEVEVTLPPRYPLEPPKVRFLTPIHHPNIDSGGRICLDTLKMPPKGAWRCSLNLHTVLSSVYLLMAEPNPDDGLMPEITREYRSNRPLFLRKARQLTEQHAVDKSNVTLGGSGSSSSSTSSSSSSSSSTPSNSSDAGSSSPSSSSSITRAAANAALEAAPPTTTSTRKRPPPPTEDASSSDSDSESSDDEEDTASVAAKPRFFTKKARTS